MDCYPLAQAPTRGEKGSAHKCSKNEIEQANLDNMAVACNMISQALPKPTATLSAWVSFSITWSDFKDVTLPCDPRRASKQTSGQ